MPQRAKLDAAQLMALEGSVLRAARDLRRLRLASGVTQTELSAAAGYDVSGISLNEGGHKQPRFNKVIDMLAALGFELVLRRTDLRE